MVRARPIHPRTAVVSDAELFPPASKRPRPTVPTRGIKECAPPGYMDRKHEKSPPPPPPLPPSRKRTHPLTPPKPPKRTKTQSASPPTPSQTPSQPPPPPLTAKNWTDLAANEHCRQALTYPPLRRPDPAHRGDLPILRVDGARNPIAADRPRGAEETRTLRCDLGRACFLEALALLTRFAVPDAQFLEWSVLVVVSHPRETSHWPHLLELFPHVELLVLARDASTVDPRLIEAAAHDAEHYCPDLEGPLHTPDTGYSADDFDDLDHDDARSHDLDPDHDAHAVRGLVRVVDGPAHVLIESLGRAQAAHRREAGDPDRARVLWIPDAAGQFPHTPPHSEERLRAQLAWFEVCRPDAALLDFDPGPDSLPPPGPSDLRARHPKYAEVWARPCADPDSLAAKLLVLGPELPKAVPVPLQQLRGQLTYHADMSRVTAWPHPVGGGSSKTSTPPHVSGPGLCHCHDCALTLVLLREYLESPMHSGSTASWTERGWVRRLAQWWLTTERRALGDASAPGRA